MRTKTSSESKVDKKTGKKKTTKRKRAKVVMPKLNNLYKPEGMLLVEWQVALRQQQAAKEAFVVSRVDDVDSSGEYRVENPAKRNAYKVVYRGKDSVWNYCSCMDFKTSQLGTCKHPDSCCEQGYRYADFLSV